METRTPGITAWPSFLRAYRELQPIHAALIGRPEYEYALPGLTEHGVSCPPVKMETLLPPKTLTTAENIDPILVKDFPRIQATEYRSKRLHRGHSCVFTGQAILSLIALSPGGPCFK
jgi:hypothetical protein